LARKRLIGLILVVVIFTAGFVAGWGLLSVNVNEPEDTPTSESMPTPEVTPEATPAPNQKEILITEIQQLAGQLLDLESLSSESIESQRELEETISDKIVSLMNDPTAISDDLRRLFVLGKLDVRYFDPIPFKDGEVSLLRYKMSTWSTNSYYYLRLIRENKVVISDGTWGDIRGVQTVEMDGVPCVAVIGAGYSGYSVDIFALAEGHLSVTNWLGTGIGWTETYPLRDPLFYIDNDGLLAVGLPDRLETSRLIKKDAQWCFEYTPADVSKPLPIRDGDAEYECSDYGLLLGLSDNDGNNRTLWIRPFDGNLRVNEISNAIVFPNRNGFSWLKNYCQTYETPPKHDEDKPSTFDFSKLLFGELGKDLSPLLDNIEPPFAYDNSYCTDRLYYVGDQYLCYVNQYSISAYRSGRSREQIFVLPLEKVNQFVMTEGDPWDFEDDVFSAYSLPGQVALKNLLGLDTGTLSRSGQSSRFYDSLDFNHIVIANSNYFGQWRVCAPLMNGITIDRFVPLDVELPGSFNGDVTMTSPDEKIFVDVSNRSVCVYVNNNDGPLITTLIEAPPHPNERIVSIRWAAPEDIPEWEDALSPYFNGD